MTLNPERLPYLRASFEALMRVGEHKTALGIISTIVEKAPEDAQAWRKKGHLLSRLRRFDEAETALREAWSRDRHDVKIRATLVDVLEHRGQVAEAAQILRSLIADHPAEETRRPQLERLEPLIPKPEPPMPEPEIPEPEVPKPEMPEPEVPKPAPASLGWRRAKWWAWAR